MNEAAKIQLSAREMELVNNTEWIFTKQLIIEKVYSLLGHLHEDYKEIINEEKDVLTCRNAETRRQNFER